MTTETALHEKLKSLNIHDVANPKQALRYRIAENEWNLKGVPWSGAIGIEDTQNNLSVPSLVCWFTRGADQADLANRVVNLLNIRGLHE